MLVGQTDARRFGVIHRDGERAGVGVAAACRWPCRSPSLRPLLKVEPLVGLQLTLLPEQLSLKVGFG
jgi:hypothetical protein